ncbi:MAG: TPRREGION domain-containing protein [Nitrospira sp.]|nr:MAG: TPRREGION domain-containing protein [Nitrospira sp.]
MYKSFYQLHSKPFSLLPDSDFLYLGSTHRTAYSLLEYGLLTEAPFMVLTGDPGTGKTSLLHRLIADNRDTYSIGFLSNARYDVEYLLPWILLALGLNTKQLDPVEAQHLFAKFLAEQAIRKRRVVLIMDEAQNLGVKLLEELRLLSNLNQEKTLQLQIILSGQPDLQTLLRRVDMTQFAQRVVVDYHIQPFTEDEVAQYIHHRIQLSGSSRPLFTPQACALTYRLSQGNPRLINQVCEMALTYGFAQQSPHITTQLLAQAALDRRKNRILPLSELEDLANIAAADGAEETERTEIRKEPGPPQEALPAATHNRPRQSAEHFYEQGMALRKSQKFIAAIAQFQQAAQDPAYHLRSFGQIGLCYRALGQVPQAVAAFRNACADYNAPRQQSLSVRYLLGRTLEQLGDKPEALEQYRLIFHTDRTFKDTATRLSNLEGNRSLPADHERPAWGIGQAWRQVRHLLKGDR